MRALEMLLRHIALTDRAEKLSRALNICCESEKKVVVTGDRSGATCAAFADYVLDTLKML